MVQLAFLGYNGTFWQSVFIVGGINAVIATGLYMSNSAGALSVAHAAIAGMGAYLGAVLTTNFAWPFPAAIGVGACLGLATGALLALATVRMNELVAGLTTLAFGEVMVVVALNLSYTHGAEGFYGIPQDTTFSVVYVMLAIVIFLAWRLDRSRLGLAARACRDDREAARALGVDVNRVKLGVFALGAGVAGAGGVLQAHYVLVVSPSDLGFFASLNLVIFWVLGGSYSLWGPTAGALFLTVLPQLLRFSAQQRYVVYGALLTAVILLRPTGLIRRRPAGTHRWLGARSESETGRQDTSCTEEQGESLTEAMGHDKWRA